MKTTIEINPNQKIAQATMADCGTEYYSNFQYRLPGDAELIGDEWREGKIAWETTEEWRAAENDYRDALAAAHDESGRLTGDMPEPGILEDESRACDWDKYIIYSDEGDIITNEIGVYETISKLL